MPRIPAVSSIEVRSLKSLSWFTMEESPLKIDIRQTGRIITHPLGLFLFHPQTAELRENENEFEKSSTAESR
jgi:hypothetical protein